MFDFGGELGREKQDERLRDKGWEDTGALVDVLMVLVPEADRRLADFRRVLGVLAGREWSGLGGGVGVLALWHASCRCAAPNCFFEGVLEEQAFVNARTLPHAALVFTGP